MSKLCQFELEVLAGDNPNVWGAAVGAAIESLRGSGYLDRQGNLTAKGHEALRQYKAGK